MINDIFKGLKVYSGAYALISKLKLWKYFAIPMVISCCVFTLIFILAYTLSSDLGAWFASAWPWEFGSSVIRFISNFISSIVIITIGFISYKHIILALSSPFMSPVSEKIEAYLTGIPVKTNRKQSFIVQLARSIRIGLRNLTKELFYTLPILLLKFIPVVNIFSTALLFLVQAYYAGFSSLDYTLERHFNYTDSVAFIRKNRGLAIGNGIGFMLLLLIPFAGIILVLPLSITSASVIAVDLLYDDEEEEDDNDDIGFEPFKKLNA